MGIRIIRTKSQKATLDSEHVLEKNVTDAFTHPRRVGRHQCVEDFAAVLGTRRGYPTWQIFNIFVPPGAPIGSPQVMA